MAAAAVACGGGVGAAESETSTAQELFGSDSDEDTSDVKGRAEINDVFVYDKNRAPAARKTLPSLFGCATFYCFT